VGGGDFEIDGSIVVKDGRAKVFLASILLVPFFMVLLSNGYVPGTDESWQLQAASRLASGKGYTCSWEPARDLSKPKYDYLIAWPPGYSIAIAGLLKTGMSLDFACKFLKILFVVLGVFLWSKILDSHIETKPSKYLFLAFLCFSSIYYAYSPTDLAFWALFPLMLSSMSGISLETVDPKKALPISKILVGSVTASILILFRYQGLVLIPIGVVWLLIYYGRDFRQAIQRVLFFVFLPVVTYLVIWYANNRFGGASNLHTNSPIQGFSWDWRWITGVLKAVFLAPLHADKFFSRLMQALGLRHFQAIILDGISLLAALVVILISVRLWKRNEKSRVVLRWFVVSLMCLVGFLGILTMFFFSHGNWKPIGEPRYYWFLIPLLVTMILVAINSRIEMSGQNVKKIIDVVISVAVLASWFGIIGYSYYQHDKYSLYGREKALILNHVVTSTGAPIGSPGRLVMAMNPFINMFLWEDFVPAYRGVDILLNKEAFFSSPTYIHLIEEEREGGTMADLASRLQMKKDTLKTGTHTISIYSRRFEQGPLFGSFSLRNTP